MSPKRNLLSRIYETKIFKGLTSDHISKEIEKGVASIRAEIPTIIKQQQDVDLGGRKAPTRGDGKALQYRRPWQLNRSIRSDRKPGSRIPFSFMRRMSETYPIARACINRRITQVTQLDWEVTTKDEIGDEKGHEAKIKVIKEWLKVPMGHATRFREMLNLIIDDVLTIDAVCFEYKRTRGGEFLYLIPVDPTTIVLRVTKTGGTPIPPDIAYGQFIAGKKITQFTTDELFYEMMHKRSNSPYGLAPMESLIIQVESALRGALFNLNYFREGNVPEGFVMLPEEVASDKDQVQEWQLWFDAIMAGNMRTTHRLKMLPAGSEYVAAKKPEDMRFERFEMWLMQQTCAVFDVPPRDIGITTEVNKASDETQHKLSIEKGLLPLANFIKEVLDMVIQTQFGFENLQFIWTNVNPVDRKEEVDIAQKEIEMGVRSIDEYRIQNSMEPIGAPHYIKAKSVTLVENLGKEEKDFVEGPEQSSENRPKADEDEIEEKEPKEEESPKKEKDDEKEKAIRAEMKKWRKCVYADLEGSRPMRKFYTRIIPKKSRKEIRLALKGIRTRHQAKLLFDRYLDQELKASFKLLKMASQMRRLEDADLVED